jgi:DnaJ-class molecular chaperone
MTNEQTVQVKLSPCPDCQGRGVIPPTTTTSGRTRTSTWGGTCEKCHGAGSVVRDVPLSELRKMLSES